MASFLNGRPVLQWLLVRWEQSFKTYKANDCQQCETDRNRFKKQVISEAIGQLVQTWGLPAWFPWSHSYWIWTSSPLKVEIENYSMPLLEYRAKRSHGVTQAFLVSWGGQFLGTASAYEYRPMGSRRVKPKHLKKQSLFRSGVKWLLSCSYLTILTILTADSGGAMTGEMPTLPTYYADVRRANHWQPSGLHKVLAAASFPEGSVSLHAAQIDHWLISVIKINWRFGHAMAWQVSKRYKATADMAKGEGIQMNEAAVWPTESWTPVKL